MTYIKRGAALANSIKSLIAGIDYAKSNFNQIKVDEWFNQYFDINVNWTIKDAEQTQICTWVLKHPVNTKRDSCLLTPATFISFGNDAIIRTNGVDFQYFNITPDTRSHYLNIINHIKIKENLQNVISKESEKLNISNKVGIHIRTWFENKFRKLICFDEDLWFKIVDEKYKIHNENLYICSDDINLLKKLKTNFQNIVCYSDNIQNKQTQPFFELMLLSKCKEIVGSYESTFTECAWWFSGCKPIEIVETNAIKVLAKELSSNK